MSSEEESVVAVLVLKEDYAKNVGQVARLTTQKVTYIKRKELSLKPFEVVEIPLADLSSIAYETKWALVPMVFGGLLVLLIAFILGSQVAAGTQVRYGALAMVLIFGISLLRGPKRHRLTFVVGGKKLKWQSKAGDYKYNRSSIQKITDFGREHGLLKTAGT